MSGNMSVSLTVVLLCISFGGSLTHTLTPSPTTEKPLSPRHYHHIDPATGKKLVCNKCPAGTYVSSHCTESSMRECSPCLEGTFTRGETGVEQCHRCQRRCPTPFIEKTPCTSTTDRLCVCPSGSFSQDGKCERHSSCPPGLGVRKPGSETEDVRCRKCQRGTFSDVTSDVLWCRPHMDCQTLGLTLLIKGTEKTDNVCAPTPAGSDSGLVGEAPVSTVSSNESAKRESTAVSPAAEIQELLVLGLNITETAVGDTDVPTTKASPDELIPIQTSAAQELPKTLHKLSFSRDYQRAEQPAVDTLSDGKAPGLGFRTIRKGSPRPSSHKHFDINEHLPWMIVLLLLLVLMVIVVCSVKRSSRVLKKGPTQDPSSIMEKAIHKKPSSPAETRERWIYYSNGQGVDILKLVAAQIGSQWIDMYKSLASANEREVAAFSNGYSADHESAYAALQHWTIRDSDANLAKLINALHRHRRIDVVEKIRSVMEDNPQVDLNKLMTAVNVGQCLSPSHKPLESPSIVVEQSPSDRSKGFFTDESEPLLLRCDSTSSKDSALSRTGSFITKEKKDTVLRQVRVDRCDLQPIFDDMLHILNPDELHVIEEIATAEDRLDRLFEIAGVKSQEASQTLLDSVYSHLPDLL
ncbi:Tumor necrosis factor receptor superfamily member 21 [Triplophysa tibetana]|uniref:Tumor necrosis factor receptor superfamily member 21 n=1 Tax=Triplophysa tibetana TaxID=1572043 RepID=A0A5A9NGW7_9TELE|nr:Tumor necrosis factor receptor superfamily member 21 [Triplophysa tibetana]